MSVCSFIYFDTCANIVQAKFTLLCRLKFQKRAGSKIQMVGQNRLRIYWKKSVSALILKEVLFPILCKSSDRNAKMQLSTINIKLCIQILVQRKRNAFRYNIVLDYIVQKLSICFSLFAMHQAKFRWSQLNRYTLPSISALWLIMRSLNWFRFAIFIE